MEKEIELKQRLKSIDNTRFMASSLSNPVNNLAEGIHKIKCKQGLDEKNAKLVERNTKTTSDDNLIEYMYLCYNRNYQKKIGKNCCEEVFIHMNTWIIGTNLTKHK